MHQTFTIKTSQCNLASLQPEMKELITGTEVYHQEDITDTCQSYVAKSNKINGMLFITTLHTTTTIRVNEIHEPMVMLDTYRKMEALVPNTLKGYLHNSKYRTKNREICNKHCDTNGAAHVKAMLFGQYQVAVPFEKKKLILGRWQHIAFIDFDGPQERKIVLSIV